jgi:tRNA G46 methylase TrmB
LLRCECTAFWRLAAQAQRQFEYHSLLYPSPYPKPQHLHRRRHGEAAFTSLLAISKKIELRTNWKIYAEEFHQALLIAKANVAPLAHIDIEQYQAETSITAFERKFIMSGHALWRVFTS